MFPETVRRSSVFLGDKRVPKPLQPKTVRLPVACLFVAVITQLVVGSTHAQLSSKKLSASKMHPTEVARQLSLLTSEQFQKISPNEFLNLGWLKPNKLEVAPNIVELISMFNTLGTWVATEVRSLARSLVYAFPTASGHTHLAGWLAGWLHRLWPNPRWHDEPRF